MSYLLDTSALLAHFFDEPGATETEAIFNRGRDEVAVSAVSVAEFEGRLTQEGIDEDERLFACLNYFSLLARVLPVIQQTGHLAADLRSRTPVRLPLVDALIAAAAKEHQLTLVHRDPHMAAIPAGDVSQLVLPPK
jgi:predicted nucleic acid-binding protein